MKDMIRKMDLAILNAQNKINTLIENWFNHA